MAAPPVPEIVLVGRVFAKITEAGTDNALEECLQRYLTPVIQKLSSNDPAVRKKVLEILEHVNNRIKNHNQIKIPVERLLVQLNDPGSSDFVVNFSMVYIKMGYCRLDSADQIRLIPKLLESIQSKPKVQNSILPILLPVLGLLKKEDIADNEDLKSISEKPQLCKILLDFLQDILLLPYGSKPQSEDKLKELFSDYQAMTAGPPREVEGETVTEESTMKIPVIPPAMNMAGYVRATSIKISSSDELEKLKMTALYFLATEIFPANSIVVPAIIGFADPRFTVANFSESFLRRLDKSIDWNQQSLMSSMYILFLGTLTPFNLTPINIFKNQSNTRIRLKLMPFFLRSRECVNFGTIALQVFNECLWGKFSNAKLKHLGINFLHHIAFNASKEKLTPVGKKLFDGVVKVIEEEKKDLRLASLAYGALAKLSLKMPNLLISEDSELHHLETLMNALNKEVGDVLLAIQEALSMVAPVCKELSPQSQEMLCILLVEHVQSNNPALRRIAVQYASTVFSKKHVASKFILLLASGDVEEDIRAEAMQELYKPRMVESADNSKESVAVYEAPPFFDMLDYSLGRINKQPKAKWIDVGTSPIPFRLHVMREMVLYLQHCLIVESHDSVGSARFGKDFSSFKVEELKWPEPHSTRDFIKKNMDRVDPESGNNCLKQYLSLCETVGDAWCPEGLQAIARFLAVSPDHLVLQYVAKTNWIYKFMIRGSNAGDTAAFLYAFVASKIQDLDKLEATLNSLNYNKDLRLESQMCLIQAIGYSLAYSKREMEANEDVIMEDNWQYYNNSAKKLVSDLMHGDASLQPSFLFAISQVARHHPLPIDLGKVENLLETKSDSSEKKKSSKDEVNLVDLVLFLFPLIESSKFTVKQRELAVKCIGAICAGENNTEVKREVMKRLFAVANATNDLDIHFSIGSSLADCVPGKRSVDPHTLWFVETKEKVEEQQVMEDEKAEEQVMEDEKMDMSESDGPVTEETPPEGTLGWLLTQLLSLSGGMSPNKRQAMCLWLLTIVQDFKFRKEVQDKLEDIQGSFETFLDHANPVVQDAASKGLCLVYEICSEDSKKKMVDSLVKNLIEGKRTVTNVSADTKIFKEGELGSSPSGSQLSTYKELCSLASDLNQPDLVYKFMNLANHNAVWSSRSAAAFGFGNLAIQANVELEKYLPKIVPKLYRYTFDPHPSTRNQMSNIWSSLVKDTKKMTEQHYERILSELLVSLTNYEWRVRESSCSALNDLIRQHSIVPAIDSLPEIWKILFRSADDFKESSRKAGIATLQSVSKNCIKICENGCSEGDAVLKMSLPILLKDGLTSPVEEVRKVSLNTVVQVCRSAGAIIKPHLGTLVPALLEAIAGLESSQWSLVSTRLTSDDDRQAVDSMRVSQANDSRMSNALNYVLDFVDEEVMDDVIPGVVDILKKSVGLTSRTTAANVLERLAITCPSPMQKHSGKILLVLLNGLTDRNGTLRRVFASVIGSLIKVAKTSSIDKLLKRLQAWYFEKDDDDIRLSSALAVRSMHTQNPDVMKDYGSLALPLAFLAMHAETAPSSDDSSAAEKTHEVWEEVWTDNTPGNEAGIKFYIQEILDLCDTAGQSNNWAMKAQTAKTLSTVATKVGTYLNEEQTKRIVTLIITLLYGRTWEGKETVILALSTVAVNTKVILTKCDTAAGEESMMDTILKVLKREANKEKKTYRLHALKAFTLVLEEFSIDEFETVFDICNPFISQSEEEQQASQDKSTEDASIQHAEKDLRWNLTDEMIQSLGRAWPAASAVDTQERYSVTFIELLSNNVSKVTRKVQLSIIETLSKYWRRLYLVNNESQADSNTGSSSIGRTPPLYDPLFESQFEPIIQNSAKIFNHCLGISKFYSLRKQSLTVLQEVANSVKSNSSILTLLSSYVVVSVEEAKRDPQPDIQHIANTLHTVLRN